MWCLTMAYKLYECGSCRYEIFAGADAKEPDFCPFCRSLMNPAGEEELPAGKDYKCEECGYEFRVPAGGAEAYKCARCNFTFPREPFKHAKRNT